LKLKNRETTEKQELAVQAILQKKQEMEGNSDWSTLPNFEAELTGQTFRALFIEVAANKDLSKHLQESKGVYFFWKVMEARLETYVYRAEFDACEQWTGFGNDLIQVDDAAGTTEDLCGCLGVYEDALRKGKDVWVAYQTWFRDQAKSTAWTQLHKSMQAWNSTPLPQFQHGQRFLAAIRAGHVKAAFEGVCHQSAREHRATQDCFGHPCRQITDHRRGRPPQIGRKLEGRS